MDRHGGWAPAVDRPGVHAHLRGGHPGEGDLVGLRLHDAALHRPVLDGRPDPARAVSALARGPGGGGRGALQPASAGGGIGMSTADVCVVILWIGVTLYAIFGGADFGAGVWDLLAG